MTHKLIQFAQDNYLHYKIDFPRDKYGAIDNVALALAYILTMNPEIGYEKNSVNWFHNFLLGLNTLKSRALLIPAFIYYWEQHSCPTYFDKATAHGMTIDLSIPFFIRMVQGKEVPVICSHLDNIIIEGDAKLFTIANSEPYEVCCMCASKIRINDDSFYPFSMAELIAELKSIFD